MKITVLSLLTFFIIFPFAGGAGVYGFGAACLSAENVTVSDISAYEKFIDPDGDEFLILINKDNPIPCNYEAEYSDDFVAVENTRRDGREIQEMRSCAAYALKALFIEAKACGINLAYSSGSPGLSVTSAYRSYAFQKALFDGSVRMYIDKGMTEAEARRYTMRYIALPGKSEHQSGLAADMHNMLTASVTFADTEEYKWLEANAHKFGFIIRYPKDKESITGISFEPWHFRFVGRRHAVIMREMNLCLEEYIDWRADIDSAPAR